MGIDFDSRSNGRGFKSRLILYKMEMVSKLCQDRFLYLIMVHSRRKERKKETLNSEQRCKPKVKRIKVKLVCLNAEIH